MAQIPEDCLYRDEIKDLVKTTAKLERALVRFDAIPQDVRAIKENIVGNGKVGLNTRVTLLEKLEDRRKWFIRTVAGGVVLLGIKAVWEMFSRVQ